MVILYKIRWIFNTTPSFNKLWNTKIPWEWIKIGVGDGVFSRDNLPKEIKDGAFVLNLDEHVDTGTHWIALFCVRDKVTYFDSFGVEHIPQEIKKFIGNKNKSKHLSCTSKWFSNVWILLYWIHWFYACRKNID